MVVLPAQGVMGTHGGWGECRVCRCGERCPAPVACGPEYPRLWEREERGGKMWDAGREKVP